MSEFGKELRRLRLERGLTQDQLAQLIGVTQGQIGHMERGNSGIGAQTLFRLADALGVNAEHFRKFLDGAE